MDDSRTIALEARMSRLERENRRWRLAAAAAGALALLAVAGHGLPSAVAKGIDLPALRAGLGSSVVEAQRFVLRDASGQPRASLAVSDDGMPLLMFLDKDGEARGVLGPKHLLLSSDDGSSAVKLLVNPGGTPAVRLEKDGRLRAVLGMTGDGTLALGFYGHDGKGRALLDVGVDGSPGLTLFSRSGKVAWSAP